VPFEELKPGDLIFYSGTYYPEKNHKPQKHDMVHVEIFIGGETGEATIGARWAKDVVKVFPSYKFVSKAYYDIKYYYKSIDTWLDGVCKSFCKEHPWQDRYDPDRIEKGSIFARDPNLLKENDQEEDCDAGDNEEANEEEILNKGKNLANSKLDKDLNKGEIVTNKNSVCIGEGNNDKMIRDHFLSKGWII